MKPVTQAQFFKAIYADPRDVMPSIVGSEWNKEKEGYATTWKTPQGAVFGWSIGTGPKGEWKLNLPA